jgi:hemolysin activation/secretion protein
MPALRADEQAAIPDTTPFLVRQLRIEGNTVVDTATLQALLATMQGQRLTLRQIAQGIEAITSYYRAAGYPLARAIIPAQTIEDGVVRVQMIEANWCQIDLRNNSAINDAVLMRTLSGLVAGRVIGIDALERATLLLSDLPGADPSALLRAGQAVGSSDLVVDVQPGAPLNVALSADNYGSRYAGVARTNARLQWNNPLGRGDSLSLNTLNSQSGGMNYVRLAYELPVWAPGVLAGVDSSGLQYRLGDTAASLLASGKATTSSVWLRGALLRSPRANLNARLSVTHKVLQDRVDSTGARTDRNSRVWGLEVSGERQDEWLGGGKNMLGLALYGGQMGFDDAAAAAQDASTARAAGNFTRATWALARTQELGNRTSALVNVNGQWAQKNLDNEQKFFIGGANSVRAYRSSVLSGDSGAFASLELRYSLPQLVQQTGSWQLAAFVDTGTVHINKTPWSIGSNQATISGAGLGLNWQGSKGLAGRIFIASSLGQVPSQLADSKPTHTNAWVELRWAFN